MAAIIGARVLPVETLGAKLRRLASIADRHNPIDHPPLVAPPGWSPNTAYSQGRVVVNAGHWYVCVTDGISAASGGPTTTGHGDAVADGTAAWTLYGAAELAADDPLAPSQSIVDVNPFESLPQTWAPALFPNNFRLYGGYPVATGDDWNPRVFANGPSSFAKGQGVSLAFTTDAPRLALIYASDGPGLGVTVDGRYLTPAASPVLSGTQWMILDFSEVGGRRERSFRVWSGKDDAVFRGVQVGPADYVKPPPDPDGVMAAFIGDSIWAGSSYGPMLPGRTLPGTVGQLLGWSDPWNVSTGGTGFLATAGNTRYTYRQRIPEILPRRPDVWVMSASRNDSGHGAAAITSEAVLTLQAIRAGSRAPIIVAGLPMSRNPAEATIITLIEDAVSAAVAQFDDPLGLTFFIPAQTDPIAPWMTGSWTNGMRSGLANAGFYLGGDNVHPVDAGTRYLARRLAGAIKERVLGRLR